MNLQDALDPRGQLTVRKMDAHDALVETIHVHNNIVLSGRDLIAKLFVKQPIDPVSHVAVGTGTVGVRATDTKLAGEIFRKPIVPVDPSQPSYTGHFTTWFGDENNKQNEVEHSTFNVHHGVGSDGSILRAHDNAQATMNANGVITVSFDKFRCG